MITIDEMQIILDELAEELPQEFYHELNGGILLLPELRMSPYAKTEDLYILGEYRVNGAMGRYIVMYYGSAMKAYGWMDADAIKKELRKTLRHEFRHHLESLSGERGLELEDNEYIRKYLADF